MVAMPEMTLTANSQLSVLEKIRTSGSRRRMLPMSLQEIVRKLLIHRRERWDMRTLGETR